MKTGIEFSAVYMLTEGCKSVKAEGEVVPVLN
jgi:hypothetical protein